MAERVIAIDNLRLASTILLVSYHAAQTFDSTTLYHIKAPREKQMAWLTLVNNFVRVWHMPLFFLLSGWALQASLKSRGLSGVISERSRKLLLPLVFGTTAFGPYLRWAEYRHGLMKTVHGRPLPSQDIPYLDIQKKYFKEPGLLTWGHLWFLAYLWTLTLLYTPVWVLLATQSPRFMPGVLIKSPCILFGPLAVLFLSEVLLRPQWPGYYNLFDDWANFVLFSIFLLLGMFSGSSASVRLVYSRHSLTLLLGGIALSIGHCTTCPQGRRPILCGLLRAGGSFGVVAGLIGQGLGLSTQAKASKPFTKLQQAAFPVYVIHQMVLLVLAEAVILPLAVPMLAQLLLLILSGFSLSYCLYRLIMAAPLLPQLMFGEPFLSKR